VPHRGIRGLQYDDRLHTLKLPSMDYRRKRGDMIKTFKYIKGLNKCDIETLFPSNPEYRTSLEDITAKS
jgi:hypothetical protein